MTAGLLIRIKSDIQEKYNLASVPHEMLCILQKNVQGRNSQCNKKGKNKVRVMTIGRFDNRGKVARKAF